LEGCFKLREGAAGLCTPIQEGGWELTVFSLFHPFQPCENTSVGIALAFHLDVKVSIYIILLLFLTWLKICSEKPRWVAELPSSGTPGTPYPQPLSPLGSCIGSSDGSAQPAGCNPRVGGRGCWADPVSRAVGELNEAARGAESPLLPAALDLAWSAVAFQFGEFKRPAR